MLEILFAIIVAIGALLRGFLGFGGAIGAILVLGILLVKLLSDLFSSPKKRSKVAPRVMWNLTRVAIGYTMIGLVALLVLPMAQPWFSIGAMLGCLFACALILG